MQIDITDFFNNEDAFEFFASVMGRGANAGRETWQNAVQAGKDAALLVTEEQLNALRKWAQESGAWDENEIAAWSDDECNALFIQLISGDIREIEDLCVGDDGEIDWKLAEELAQKGQIGGSLYRGDIPGSKGFGRIFYYLGD